MKYIFLFLVFCVSFLNLKSQNDSDTLNIWVPNALTPNDDGINDFFYISYSGEIVKFNIQIYNRYGEKIFESSDPDFRWECGDEYYVQTYPYSYVIVYFINDKVKKTKFGHIFIVR